VHEYEAALDLDPLSPSMSQSMGFEFFMMGEYERAIEQAEKTLELDPTYGPTHLMLGWIHKRRGDLSNAIDILGRATILDDSPLYLASEMVEPLFRVTIDYPYALRSSLIYVSSLLLRETARLLRFTFKDFKDRDITYKTIEGFRPLAEAQGWTGFDMFLQKLSEINSKEFVEQTQNYRNRFHHQVEPNLEMGLLQSVVRQEGIRSFIVRVWRGKSREALPNFTTARFPI